MIALFLISISSVQAEIGNPSFEDGVLSPWVGHVSYSGEVSVVNSTIYDGGYAVKVQVLDTTSQHSDIYQTGVDLTGVDEITFMLWCSYVGASIGFYVDSDYIPLTSPGSASWVEMSVNVSSYSGNHTIKYQINNGNNQGYKTTYVDAFKLDGVGWNPTLSGYVTNSSSNAVSSATIILNNSGGSATSNDAGYYEIVVSGGGSYMVTASSATAGNYNSVVEINSDTTLNITLTNPTIFSDETINPGLISQHGTAYISVIVQDDDGIDGMNVTVLGPGGEQKEYTMFMQGVDDTNSRWMKPFVETSLTGTYSTVSFTATDNVGNVVSTAGNESFFVQPAAGYGGGGGGGMPGTDGDRPPSSDGDEGGLPGEPGEDGIDDGADDGVVNPPPSTDSDGGGGGDSIVVGGGFWEWLYGPGTETNFYVMEYFETLFIYWPFVDERQTAAFSLLGNREIVNCVGMYCVPDGSRASIYYTIADDSDWFFMTYLDMVTLWDDKGNSTDVTVKVHSVNAGAWLDLAVPVPLDSVFSYLVKIGADDLMVGVRGWLVGVFIFLVALAAMKER